MAAVYEMSVPVFVKMLGNLSAILDKAVAYAEAKKIEPAVLLNSRLYPDMFPLTRQVQIASDFAKGTTARLAGQEPPKWDDNEASFAELKQRIARTIEFVKSFSAAQLEGAEQRPIEWKMRGQTVGKLPGTAYLAHVALPNFYFHVTTAYDILRKDGVELSKQDYVGRP